MDTHVIHLTAQKALQGSISFPELVGTLLAAGVESYHVDYVAARKTYYGADGSVAVTPLTYEGLPDVAADFASDRLKAAILDSQRHGQKFRDFTRRAMEAGVQGYIAYLAGQRVVYWGRQGDQHIEWFPGAARNAAP